MPSKQRKMCYLVKIYVQEMLELAAQLDRGSENSYCLYFLYSTFAADDNVPRMKVSHCSLLK